MVVKVVTGSKPGGSKRNAISNVRYLITYAIEWPILLYVIKSPRSGKSGKKRDVFETVFFWSKNIIVIMQEILIKTTSILETDFFFSGICESLRRVWLYLVILGFDAWLGSRGISGFDAPGSLETMDQ